MTDKALATKNDVDLSIMEQVFMTGDLSKLSPQQRVSYYGQVCESVGLNPLTRPFDYITLNSKLTLYAKRDAADQLRSINGISIDPPQISFQDDLVIVTVTARDKNGRTDTDLGAVTIGTLRGEAKANAIMKAITKAKRRVTLSIAGLGWLDETEIESIPGAQKVDVAPTGELPKIHAPANGKQVVTLKFEEPPADAEFVDAPMVQAAQELGGKPKSVMTLKEAEDVKNSEGLRYGDLKDDQLGGMATSIKKAMKKTGVTPEQMEQYKTKLQAIDIILDWRNPAVQGPDETPWEEH
jgi:hypothetical protein